MVTPAGADGYLPPVHGHPTYVVHIGADGPDGLLAWRPTRDFELDGALARIAVDDLIAADDLAYRNLWAIWAESTPSGGRTRLAAGRRTDPLAAR